MKYKIIVLGLAVLLVVGWSQEVKAQELAVSDTTQPAMVKYKYYFAEGLRFKMLGNQEQAMQMFQKAAELNQVSGSAFYELALLYSDKKEYSAAVGYARNAWKRDPTNKWYGLMLIENLKMEGKQIECVPIYRELQKVDPNEQEFKTAEIEMLIQGKQEKEALSRLDKLPKDIDMERWATVKKKDIYFSINKFDKGTKVLLDWLKKYPADVDIRGILAEAYATKGNNEEALAQYKILKEKDPDNPAISFSLGQFYYQTGKKKEALEEFLTGFRSPDVNPAIKMEIVKAYIGAQSQQLKLDDEVVKLIETVYQVDKGNPDVDLLYANFLYSGEKLKEAEPIYRKLTRTDPGNFMVWQNLLFILNEQKRFGEILSVSDSALIYFPGQGLFHLFRGFAAIDKKDYTVAISALKKGLGIPGQPAEIIKQFYLSLAEALYRNGNIAEAFTNFDQMLVLEPENAQVLNNYSYYLALGEKDLDKALEMITKCVNQEPENPTYLDTFAWVLYQRKEYVKALEPIEKTIKLSKDLSGEVMEHYGDILFRNGKPEEAKQAWLKAKESKEASDKIDSKIINGLK